MWLIIMTNAIYATTYGFSKYLLTYMSPLYLSGLRMAIGGFVILSYLLAFDIKKILVKRALWVNLLIIAFFNIFLSYALELWALQYISSIKVTFLYNLGPLVTPLFSYWFFAEKMTYKKWIGLAIGFCGAMPALLNGKSYTSFFGMKGIISWPVIAVLLAVLAYCFGWVFIRKMVREQGYSPVTVSAWIMFLGGLMSLMVAPFLETLLPLPTFSSFYICFGLLIILGNFIAMLLYTMLFKYYTITLISFASLLIPIFASIYGYFFLGEHLSWQLVTSMLIVWVGLYIFYQEELRQGYVIQRKK